MIHRGFLAGILVLASLCAHASRVGPGDYLRGGMSIGQARYLLTHDAWQPIQLNFRKKETLQSIKRIDGLERFIKDYGRCVAGTPFCVFFFQKNESCVRIDTTGGRIVDMQLIGLDSEKKCDGQPSGSLYVGDLESAARKSFL